MYAESEKLGFVPFPETGEIFWMDVKYDARVVRRSERFLYPDGWDYSCFLQNRPEYRLDNQGFRIDYFMVSEELMPFVKKSEILTDLFDTTNNPVLLEIDLPDTL